MGMMPTHTPPAMSIVGPASGHIEHWYDENL